MQSVFERVSKDDRLEGVPLADYEPYQLVAHLRRAYPGDPKGALEILKNNLEIGFVLYSVTLTLLEGLDSVKGNEMLRGLSK